MNRSGKPPRPAGEEMRPKCCALLIAGMVVCALFFRVPFLGTAALSSVEGDTLLAASLPVSKIFELTGRVPAAPAVPLLYKAWAMWAGRGQARLEMLGLIFGVLSIAAAAIFAACFYGRSVAVIAALLMTVSVLHLTVSQQIGGLPPAVFFSICAAMALMRWLEKPQTLSAGAFVLAAWLCTALHAFGLLLSAAFFIYALSRRAPRFPLLAMFSLLSLLCVPQIAAIIEVWRTTGGHGLPATTDNIMRMLQALASNSAVLTPLMLNVIAAGFFLARRRSGDRRPWDFLVAWCLAPLLLMIVLSKLFAPFAAVSHVSLLLPPYLLLAARGIQEMPRGAGALVIVAILGLTTPAIRDYYRGATNAISPRHECLTASERYQAGDAILHLSSGTLGACLFYHGHSYNEYYLPRPGQTAASSLYPSVTLADAAKFSRFWLILHPKAHTQHSLQSLFDRDVFKHRHPVVLLQSPHLALVRLDEPRV